MNKWTRVLFAIVALLVTCAASAQLTVDAQGPIRERRRQATSGTGGGIGRKLLVRVAIEPRNPHAEDKAGTAVDFVVTNLGNDNFTVPVSPNPRDLEPSDPEAKYTLLCLRLYITSDRSQRSVLVPETSLYGSQAFPGSLATLAPGESVRVLSRLKLSLQPSQAGVNASVFVAHVTLVKETINTIKGRTVSDSREVGSSSSSEYTAQALLGQP